MGTKTTLDGGAPPGPGIPSMLRSLLPQTNMLPSVSNKLIDATKDGAPYRELF